MLNSIYTENVTSKIGNTEVTHAKDSITIKIKNSTLEDLKQNLINKLNEHVGNLDGYETEVELLKVILDSEK